MKVAVLAFGAHPDDVELGCGGTLAKMHSQGKKIGIVDLTRGELGTRGTPEIRDKEATAAAKILGAQVRENLGMADGFFENNPKNQLKIIEKIRAYQPEIVLCNAPTDRHPDHGKGAELVKTACFLSGLRKIYTGQNAWRPKYVFHYIQWQNLTPDFVLNITGYLDKKVEACMAYQSQFHDPNSQEPETPISSKNFTESIRYRSLDMGRLIGKEAGEGFISAQPLGIDDLEVWC